MTSVVIVIALLLDQLLGEVKKWHPLVGFGRMAQYVERRFNRQPGSKKHMVGVLGVTILVPPLVLSSLALSIWLGPLFDMALLYFAVGARSLVEHARAVIDALEMADLELARQRVGMIVSRDTTAMQRTDIVRATIESVLENGADAIFAPLFWFIVAGAPGVVLYRLVNTLDAMWGYRTERFSQFGWCAARLDDLLNWLPARITALGYAMMGNARASLTSWRTQSGLLDSPNAGVVMTAGAGALGVMLGGPCSYWGTSVDKAYFGVGQSPFSGDIYRAIDLLHKNMILWIVVVLVGGWILA
ncbi:adenosylcobinamide-phosphate synthase CbiB [Sedimenticola sp.]|uniref:adenosylcobinamide-phosphate synthase CbiB n=1 Tax=Sedimenticola sp. TaxID=1940285 RepID=UPI003D14FB2A